jgi:hypothetical protein
MCTLVMPSKEKLVTGPEDARAGHVRWFVAEIYIEDT